MKDSAMKRVFWMGIIGILLFAFAYGSFVWSLGQTIRFTRLLVVDETFGAIAGIAVQFFPTFALYMASSLNEKNENEQKERLLWLGSFWVVSIFDALTNVGARFDRASAGELPSADFANEEYAAVLTYLLIGAGVLLDIGIVFAEEVLGHIVSAFFDNFAALLKLMFGISPPKWMVMVSSIGRAVGGSTNGGNMIPGLSNLSGGKQSGKGGHGGQQRGKKPQRGPGIAMPDIGLRPQQNPNQPRRDPNRAPRVRRPGDRRP